MSQLWKRRIEYKARRLNNYYSSKHKLKESGIHNIMCEIDKIKEKKRE